MLPGPVSRSESMVQDFKKKDIDFAADVNMITYLLKGKRGLRGLALVASTSAPS